MSSHYVMEVGNLLNRWFRVLFAITLIPSSFGAVLFQDGFESGTLAPAWTISTTEQGRVTVSTNFVPASGQWQLILDDSVNDAVYSVAEATLDVDLSVKHNIVLSFQAKSLGNEPDYAYGSDIPFDGVTISADGGAIWRNVATLANVSTNWQSFSVSLDSYLWNGITWETGQNVLIRFSEYDNASAPLDGIAIDDVTVTADDLQRSVLEVPTQLLEGTGPYTGYVLLSIAPTNDLTLTLVPEVSGLLVLPEAVTVPAGMTWASFSFSPANDDLANLTRSTLLSAVGEGVLSDYTHVMVLDDDAPKVTLQCPAQLIEGQYSNLNASVTLDHPATVDYRLYITASPSGETYTEHYVVVPAGQTQAFFTVYAHDDSVVDGNIPSTLVASDYEAGVSVATNYFTTINNDVAALSLSLPETMLEGGSATGQVMLLHYFATNIVVKLASSDPTALAIPNGVTIALGTLSASFPMVATDNSLQDGSRVVTITAEANGIPPTNQDLTLRDNEVAGFVFGALSNIVNVSSPVTVSVLAADVEGNALSNFNGRASLSIVLPDGVTQSLAPTNVNLSNGSWEGVVTLPPVNVAPLRLRATSTNGVSGDSPPFDIMRVIDLPAADLAWDPTRGRIYASVPTVATNAYANHVVTIDPATAAVAGSVLIAQDPGQLALTSGGEYLYVVRNANGMISQIDASNLTVASTFSVGTDPTYGTLYAGDISTVTGQPDSLVIFQKALHYSSAGNAVAFYDHGVPRSVKIAVGNSGFIEPSADSNAFFELDSSSYALRRFGVTTSGITNLKSDSVLIDNYPTSMRSDGNTVFLSTGAEVDGAQMKQLGTFPVSGTVQPDLAVHRVYFLERLPRFYQGYNAIGAYDPITFANIRRLTLSLPLDSPTSFIRWGSNGLAVATSSSVVLINSSELVPGGASANLAVTLQATPSPTMVAAPLTYTLCVSNQGPGVATGTLLQATLSDGQMIQSAASTKGIANISSNTIVVRIGDLTPNESVVLTITTLPQSSGEVTCVGIATSQAPDPDFANNTATSLVSVGYELALDTVNTLRLPANNLVYDTTRDVLWASFPSNAPPPLGESIISIDPESGVFSSPIPIQANPMQQCMTISTNGRYLYVGLRDASEMYRLDLDSMTSLSIPLGSNQWSGPIHARDINPLPGDGTSVLVAGDDQSVSVFDGMNRRPNHTSGYSINEVEPTANPNVYVGKEQYGGTLYSLSIDASGVSINRSVQNVVTSGHIDATGPFVLSGSGRLVDSSNLTLIASFGPYSGEPCLDLANHRGYVFDQNKLHGFDTQTLLPVGDFAFPISYLSTQTCLRWGLDGFAVLGDNGIIYMVRWSSTIPPDVDSDANGFSDAWEATYFNALNINPAGDEDGDGIPDFIEYLFGTSPVEASDNPLRASASRGGDQTILRLVFPRRTGITPKP